MTPAAQSVQNFGTATNPANNAAIATIAAGSLPAGRYRIQCVVAYGGVAGPINGMELRAGAAVLNLIPQAITINFVTMCSHQQYRDLDGSTALTINANPGGGVGAIYNALLIATRVKT